MSARTDWPFGEFLTEAIRTSGMSKRSIARATGMSEARIRQLEAGHQTSASQPSGARVRTTEKTVYALAAVLGFDPREGLTLAGLDPNWTPTEPWQPRTTLGAWSVDELLTEVGDRYKAALVSVAARPPAETVELTIHDVLSRSSTITALEGLAEERRAAGDDSGADRLARLALEMHAELDAMDAAETSPHD